MGYDSIKVGSKRHLVIGIQSPTQTLTSVCMLPHCELREHNLPNHGDRYGQ